MSSVFVHALMLLIHIALFASPPAHAESDGWKQISQEDAKLVFYAPGLSASTVSFERWDIDRNHKAERAYWSGPPEAFIILEQLGYNSRTFFTRKA